MTKRILLVHPTFEPGSSHTLVYRKGYGSAVPMGLAYVGATLINRGYEVQVFDFQVEDGGIFEVVRDFAPDLIGLSVTTPAANAAAFLAGQFKERFPNIPVAAGGPHPSTLRGAMLRDIPALDYLVIGEGEETAVELMEILSGERSPSSVRGLCYRDGDDIKVTGERPILENLDDLPRLPLELFKYRKYVPTPGTFVHLPNVAFLSSRGCPYKCVFCNKDMFGSSIRQMSAKRMVDEILEMKENFGVREINFYDDTFTVNKKRVLELCDELIRRKVGIRWKCNSRVNCVTKDLLLKMKEAGCFSISFGVESGDDEILRKIKKKITTDQVRDAFRWTKELGISRAAFFMLNLPGDTRETVEKTIQFSREIDPDYVSFEMTKPLPGTTIEKTLEGEDNVKIKQELWDDWDSCSISNKVYYTQNDLTEDYLEEAFSRAVKRFYISPSYILRSFMRLRSWPQFKSYVGAAMNIVSAKVSRSVG